MEKMLLTLPYTLPLVSGSSGLRLLGELIILETSPKCEEITKFLSHIFCRFCRLFSPMVSGWAGGGKKFVRAVS